MTRQGAGSVAPNTPTSRKSNLARLLAPCDRLVCARLQINDRLTGHWNKSRIERILASGGTVKAALFVIRPGGQK
jgi:hypothetical protein